MVRYLPYFVARHAALELDRQGVEPSLFLRLVTGIASLATLGLLCILAFGVTVGVLSALGIIR